MKISNVIKIKQPSYSDIYNNLLQNNPGIDKTIIEQYLNINKNKLLSYQANLIRYY